MKTRVCIVVSCEHGGNRVPPVYRHLFPPGDRLLASHRGWDPGALVFARALARGLDARLFHATTTRLLIDLNRSPHHAALFSPYTRRLDDGEKQRIMARYYIPYRRALEAYIARHCRAGRTVLHLSAHTFCPRLGGTVRQADLGLLYDPRRRRERSLCRNLKQILQASRPGLKVRRNYPYRGAADGLTNWLRHCFKAQQYLGIELELNQRLTRAAPAQQRSLHRAIVASLQAAVHNQKHN